MGGSKSESLSRLCSTSPSNKASINDKVAKSKPETQNGMGTSTEHSTDKKSSISADPSSQRETDPASRVDHIEEEKPKANSEKANAASDQSTFVEDDAKQQMKRLRGKTILTVMHSFESALLGFLDDLSNGGNQEAFNFHQQVRQGNSASSSFWSWFTEPMMLVEGLFNGFYGRVIRNIIDMNFDVREFLEGAKDAFYMVNQLFEEGDYETLKPMISTKLHENMKLTSEHFQNEGLQFSVSPENIIGSYVSGLKIVKAKSLISFGSEFDIPETTEGKENFWILIYVRFTRNEHYKLFRSTGEVVQDTMSLRRDLWTFVRGPINVLPMKDDSPGWTVLSIA